MLTLWGWLIYKALDGGFDFSEFDDHDAFYRRDSMFDVLFTGFFFTGMAL